MKMSIAWACFFLAVGVAVVAAQDKESDACMDGRQKFANKNCMDEMHAETEACRRVAFQYCMDGCDCEYRLYHNQHLDLPGQFRIQGVFKLDIGPDNDVAICKAHCDGDSECLYFNHNRTRKFCYFKTTTPAKQASNWKNNTDTDGYLKVCNQDKSQCSALSGFTPEVCINMQTSQRDKIKIQSKKDDLQAKVEAAKDKLKAAEDKVKAAEDKVKAAEDKVEAAKDKLKAAEDGLQTYLNKVEMQEKEFEKKLGDKGCQVAENEKKQANFAQWFQ